MKRRARRSAEHEIVLGCEAFVAGRYVDYLQAHHETVPSWGWLNLLAHGGVDDLIAGSHVRVRIASSTQRWRAAQAYLAQEILGLLDGHADALVELQRTVLCPLEHELSSRLALDWRPPQLVSSVLAALDDRDAMQRRERHPIEKSKPPES